MRGRGENPPRLARWVVELLLPPADAGAMTGDLDEEFRRFMLPERGVFRANLWYWRQVLLSAPTLVWRRWKGDVQHGWMASDVRHAFRLIRRRPGFSAAVIVTLTLGLGVNTTVFSVVNAVLVAPLPYEAPERIVRLQPDELFFTNASEAVALDERLNTLEAFVPWGRTFFSFSYPSVGEVRDL